MSGGRAKDLGLRRANDIGVAAKAGKCKNVAPDKARVDSIADLINSSRDLVARHDRDFGEVGIQPQAAHDVGEIYAARLYANPHLAGGRLRIGRLLDDKNLGRAGLGNPYLPHDRLPRKDDGKERKAIPV